MGYRHRSVSPKYHGKEGVMERQYPRTEPNGNQRFSMRHHAINLTNMYNISTIVYRLFYMLYSVFCTKLPQEVSFQNNMIVMHLLHSTC